MKASTPYAHTVWVLGWRDKGLMFEVWGVGLRPVRRGPRCIEDLCVTVCVRVSATLGACHLQDTGSAQGKVWV